MTTFAFNRYNDKPIYKFTAGNPAPPDEVCKAKVPIQSLAAARDGGFYVIDAVASKIIWKHDLPDSEYQYYQHDHWIRCVRTRLVANKERIYFLAFRTTTTAEIFYLDSNNVAVSYYVIYSDAFLYPDPCSPGDDTYWEQPPGQFAFDFNDNLYLILPNTTPSGIWMVTGAGPDSVTGGVALLCGEYEPVDGLCSDGNKLYFHRDGTMIYSVDPVSMVKTSFFDTAAIPGPEPVWDITCHPAVTGTPPSYKVIKILKKFWEWIAPGK